MCKVVPITCSVAFPTVTIGWEAPMMRHNIVIYYDTHRTRVPFILSLFDRHGCHTHKRQILPEEMTRIQTRCCPDRGSHFVTTVSLSRCPSSDTQRREPRRYKRQGETIDHQQRNCINYEDTKTHFRHNPDILCKKTAWKGDWHSIDVPLLSGGGLDVSVRRVADGLL